MKKSKAVIFFPGGVKIVTNSDLSGITHPFLVDPDLSAVRHLPPDRWALADGKVVPGSPLSSPLSEPLMAAIEASEAPSAPAVATHPRLISILVGLSLAMHLITLAILIRGH